MIKPIEDRTKALVVLVIDDDRGDRTLCRRALEAAWSGGVRVMESESGEAGLDSIEQEKPDCVLLDYSLPGINGLEVLKDIRSKHPHLAVVMLDGKGKDTIAVQSMKEGAQDYIVKRAITPSILQRAIQFGIDHCAMQQRMDKQRTSLEIFTRALAHDLKEPVRTIRSFLDRIPDSSSLSEKSQRSFNYIRKAADRMDALIDAVYLYTKLDAPEHVEKRPCNMEEILEAVRENLAQLISERGATITSGPLPVTNANEVQMIQLLQNLIANAIRHCDAAVSIYVSSEEHDDHWRLMVRDNGPGIAKLHFEHIFDPFRRYSPNRKGEPGLGLGLAINRKIMEAHDGIIWCESELGRGTTFLVTLPKIVASTATRPAASVDIGSKDIRSTGTSEKRARILLVDDNESDIELNRNILIESTKLQCDVMTAGDGGEALIMLRDATNQGQPIDLILLDINMPVMSGFDLLECMKKEEPPFGAMIVMCTTSASDTDKRTAAKLGASGYLTKPPIFSKLKAIIDKSARIYFCQDGEDFSLRSCSVA